MEFPLLKCNPLVRRNSNTWSRDSKDKFDYSDGDTAEEYLKEVIIKAKDLTSQSLELEEKIVDWVSEYHFSSQRANLLRGLNLEGIRNVLELGCGCGAITRYLGELRINVDAVEGNLRRAEINSLRCRDLENVSVINANFNDLTFPKRAYDAVFLIGVLEYARRFLPTAKDDKDAVIKVLSRAKSALKKEGLLFIAAENRMGLKYWMGASEDHYGQPHVGLYGYPQDQGIRTYDKREWEDILGEAGIKCNRFCYPFPDYKLPRVILPDTYVSSDEYAHSVLYRISSRDYLKEWQPDVSEFLLWESLHQSGYLEHFANSFFIVISDSMEQLNNVIPYDFVYLSDHERKPIYRTVTMKPRGKDYIVKRKMTSIEVENGDEFIKQNLSRSTYIKGPLLSSIWLHSLVGCDDTTRFEKLIHEYYCFLLEYFNKREESNDTLDLLPFNIMLDDKGLYRVIDKEWIITARISPEYVLFRALLWFFHNDKELLSRICEIKNIVNVKGFIEYGFSSLSLALDQELDKLIELEERVQREVIFQREPSPVRSMLIEPLQHVALELQSKTFLAQLFWAGENEVFCEENSITLSAQSGPNRQVLIFKLPRSAHTVRRLRLDPAGCQGFFHMFKVVLKRYDLQETLQEVLWQLQGARQIAINSEMEDVHLCTAVLGEVFLSTSDDPQIVFELPWTVTADIRDGVLQLEVEMDCPKSADYLIAMDALGKEKVLQTQQIEAKDAHIKIIESELNLIKQSKVWRMAEFFRRLFYIRLS